MIPEWLTLLLIKQKNHNKRFGQLEFKLLETLMSWTSYTISCFPFRWYTTYRNINTWKNVNINKDLIQACSVNSVHLMRLQKAGEYKIWEKIKTFYQTLAKISNRSPQSQKRSSPNCLFLKLSFFPEKCFLSSKTKFLC